MGGGAYDTYLVFLFEDVYTLQILKEIVQMFEQHFIK